MSYWRATLGIPATWLTFSSACNMKGLPHPFLAEIRSGLHACLKRATKQRFPTLPKKYVSFTSYWCIPVGPRLVLAYLCVAQFFRNRASSETCL
jgi:hypothetical protein